MKERTEENILFASVVALFLAWLWLSAAVVYSGLPRWWGMIPVGKLPGSLFLALAVLCTLVLAGLLHDTLSVSLKKAVNFLDRSGPACHAATLALFYAVGFLLSWTFRSENHFMGDGWVYIDRVTEPFQLIPDRPLDFFIHQLAYRLILLLGLNSGELAYALVHCLLFPFFLHILWTLAGKISPEPVKRAALMLIISGTTAVQLFCGYVECYTLLAFWTALFLAAGIDYAGKRLSNTWPWLPSLLFLIAFFSHRSGVFLAPSLLLLWLAKFRSLKRPGESGLISFLIILSLSPFPLLFVLLFHHPIVSLLVPVLPGNPNVVPYTLFSPAHLWEKFNFVLLIVPVAVIVLPVIIIGWRKIRAQEETGFLFMTLAAAGSASFCLLINPLLGLRDWDLLSICAIPLAAWCGWSLIRIFSTRVAIDNFLLSMGLALSLHAALWIWVNSDMIRGVAFLQRVRREDYHTVTDKVNLAVALKNHGFVRESFEQNRLATGAMENQALLNMGNYYLDTGQPDSLLFYFKRFIMNMNTADGVNLPQVPMLCIYISAAFELAGLPDSANYYYTLPLRDRNSYPDDARDWWLQKMKTTFYLNMKRVEKDQFNIDLILFFLRYNSLAQRQQYLSNTYNYYKSANFTQDQWKKLIDFAKVSGQQEYVDTLVLYAGRRFPELHADTALSRKSN